MRRFLWLTTLLLALLIAAGSEGVSAKSIPEAGHASTVSADPSSKIALALLKQLARGETPRALIIMAEQADTAPARTLQTKQARGVFVLDTLRAKSEQTQGGVRADLDGA